MQQVIVIGEAGEQLGIVAEFEIDRVGRLKSVILVCSSSLRERKRIAVDQIRSMQDNVLRVAFSSRDVARLEDAGSPSMQGSDPGMEGGR